MLTILLILADGQIITGVGKATSGTPGARRGKPVCLSDDIRNDLLLYRVKLSAFRPPQFPLSWPSYCRLCIFEMLNITMIVEDHGTKKLLL